MLFVFNHLAREQDSKSQRPQRLADPAFLALDDAAELAAG